MERYIALLRGINVGGHRKILMKDLKELLANNDFHNVKTYIQSGNIIFDYHPKVEKNEIANKIWQIIKGKYDYDVPTVVIQSNELSNFIEHNPFKDEDSSKLLITFLHQIPSKNKLEELNSISFDEGKFLANENCIYLYIGGVYYKSKLSNDFFERKLDVKATTRNIKTCFKLLELVQ